MFSEHQSLYFAHWLTCLGRTGNQVSRAAASARVDMNPHQVEAACFALQSPLTKGVLLADEVGLGKTIEAGLVMAQRWAERKYRILLVVPASLRKQWSQELADKFELPSVLLDSKIARDLRAQGVTNPFEQRERIVICSYEYLSRQKELVQAVDWELVVFDEAHKLRNLYRKDGNKIAKNIQQATLHAESKILLSATPIQNNLMELYGLAQVMDDHFFGDENSFRALYVNRQKNQNSLDDLRRRIKPIVHRTLRKQVQEEGGINFTNRYSLTQDFTPNEDEWELHQLISAYLQQETLHAVQPQARHLVTIGMRKILASSSRAIAATLEKMIRRLEEKQLLGEECVDDLEEADEWRDRFDESPTESTSQALANEISDLKQYRELAEKITSNAKSDALLTVLGRAFEMTESLGGAHKAVIFTESRRTQQFIKEQLEANGYQGRVVLLNGSNSDPESRAIYKSWLEKHAGSARITGVKAADMKAALVERFRSDEADILVSTEAGGEGINLQFCSLLINYDLPWNPQKVEQRIGRVHRYGQKSDVVVVNFVNRKNPADKRVFELLSEKFKLFEGVFGASDEILGAIESNIDIEKRIYEIYQKCRNDEQIEYEFDQLQQEMDEVLAVREAQTRQTLLNHMDRDVIAKLRLSRVDSRVFLSGYEEVLLNLAKAELPGIEVKQDHFFHQGQRYDLSWDAAEKNDAEFFRLQASELKLAWDLVRQAKGRKPGEAPMPPAELTLHYNKMEGQFSSLHPYLGQSGLLAVEKLTFRYAGTKEEHLLVAAITDGGEGLHAEDAEKLLRIPATSTPLLPFDTSPLHEVMDSLRAAKEAETSEKLAEYFEQENSKLERWADDRRQALQLAIDELDREIKELKRASRQLSSLQEKVDAKRHIKQKERERDNAMASYHEAKKVIEQQEDDLLDKIEARLKMVAHQEPLFAVRWRLNH